MSRAIPKPVYPLDLDSDYTLFKTYNSAQSTLARNLTKESEVIEIVPRTANEADVWSENGYVTISKELIYYDSVVKNSSNKIVQFKDCKRGIEGEINSYLVGTPVYANVVAQSHNQLVDAVLAIEETIGDISEMLKSGPLLKVQQGMRKPVVKPQLVADIDHSLTASLNNSLTSMLGFAPMSDDACPEVEFEFNFLPGGLAEFCVRIFGNYTAFQIDFDDGNIESNQLSGIHQYLGVGPYNPTVTVTSPNCALVQTPTTPDGSCETPPLPDPSIPFVVQIPSVAPWPSFIPPRMTCPGPLLNLPPIVFPEVNLCPSTSTICPSFVCPAPSVIISVIEACKTPQIIKVVSPCRLSIVSLVGCEMPSVISLVGCCPPSIISVIAPSFDCVSFCQPPSFALVSFAPVPSFDCVSFCQPPSIPPISFTEFPSVAAISFDVLVNLSLAPICFCQPPSFACISFCDPPAISVNWGVPPTVSCVVSVRCPASSTPVEPQGFALGSNMGMSPNTEEEDFGIPVTIGDLGIPEEIVIRAPNIPDIKVLHDIPKEIVVKSTIPEEITITHNIPRMIEVVSDIPNVISVDATSLPRKLLVEPAPNFPSVLQLEIVGMPQTLQVVGIPNTIEIIENIPRTIQLLMPENPTVVMKWDGVPVEMKPSPDLEKMLANLMVQPK